MSIISGPERPCRTRTRSIPNTGCLSKAGKSFPCRSPISSVHGSFAGSASDEVQLLMEITVSPSYDLSDLAVRWMELETRADGGFFLFWQWIGSWLRATGAR